MVKSGVGRLVFSLEQEGRIAVEQGEAALKGSGIKWGSWQLTTSALVK